MLRLIQVIIAGCDFFSIVSASSYTLCSGGGPGSGSRRDGIAVSAHRGEADETPSHGRPHRATHRRLHHGRKVREAFILAGVYGGINIFIKKYHIKGVTYRGFGRKWSWQATVRVTCPSRVLRVLYEPHAGCMHIFCRAGKPNLKLQNSSGSV